MKKTIFIFSIAINICSVGFLIGKRIYYSNYSSFHHYYKSYDYNNARKSIFNVLDIDTASIVFVGNSLTEGFMVTEIFGTKCKNRGVNGNRISDMLNRISDITKYKPKKIFIEGGTNDINGGESPENTFEDYKFLIKKIKLESDRTKVYIQSVLPVGQVYGNNDKIIKLNNYLKKYCKDCDITFIDLYARFEDDGHLVESLTYDGIHVNGNGYKVWGEIIMPYID